MINHTFLRVLGLSFITAAATSGYSDGSAESLLSTRYVRIGH